MDLARIDHRPLLITLLVVGWLVLSSSGGLRAVIVLANLTTEAQRVADDPLIRLMREVPELVSDSERIGLTQRVAALELDRRLAGPLLVVAVLGMVGALWLLRPRRRARTLLLCVGASAFTITVVHTIVSAQLMLVSAAGLPEAEELAELFYSVAGINILLQSLPLVLVVAFLRHPVAAGWMATLER